MTQSNPKHRPRFFMHLLKIVAFMVATICLLLALLSLVQLFATRIERSENPAPGKLVSVDGKKIHVYSAGEGDTTYVMLSGGGIGVPVLEYQPLWSRLAEHGRIAVVEYPGYGWSEDTDAPRTTEQMVADIRAALSGANIQPPYVLVAHSIGGLYAMEYAKSYPKELEAIVALDTTLPQSLAEAQKHDLSIQDSVPQLQPVALLRKAGILRALLWFNPLLVSGAPDGVYTEQEARQIAMVTSWNYASNALLNEFSALPENMEGLYDFAFPTDLPVLMIQACPPGEANEAAEWSLSERQRLIAPLDHGKVIKLPAGHSGIYWLLSDDIVRETLSFLGK